MRVALAASLVLVVALQLGCGGSAPEPATTPPPSDDPPKAAPGTPTLDTAVDAIKHTAGYRYRFDMSAPNNDNNAVTDREVYLYFWPDTSRVWFRIENRLGTPIRILWDQMRFTNPFGEVYPVIHEGVTYDRRYDPQNYTELPGFGRTQDWMAPLDLLEDPRTGAGRLMRPLFPTDASAVEMIGRSFGASFVLEIEGQPRTYNLQFRVASVVPPQ